MRRRRRKGVIVRDAVIATCRNLLYEVAHELDRIGHDREARQLFTVADVMNIALDFGDREVSPSEVRAWLDELEEE